MRGVVLAGGAGSRLRPITFAMSKQLVPVANQPILFYGMRDLAEAGIDEVGIIISPETGDEIRRAVGKGDQFGLKRVEFIVQEKPLGLAHALQMALPFVDGDDCLMYLGDNLIKRGVADTVADFEDHRPNAQILLARVPNPSEFGVAQLADDGTVVRLVEKPKVPPTDLALVGCYLFDASVQEAIDNIKPSGRGELEITDAIQWLIDNGREVRASMITGWWKDTGKKEDLLHANELVLSDLSEKIHGEVIGTEIRGAVVIGEGSRVVDSHIVGPVVIGENVEVVRSRLGPNTTIGDRSHIHDAAIEDSLLMDGAEVSNWKLRYSLMGRDARLSGSPAPGFVELTIGERSEIVGT